MTDTDKPWRAYPQEQLIAQHKARLNYMPWLYLRLKAKQMLWARPWQDELQTRLSSLETISFGRDCFVAEGARLFAEPGRTITIGSRSHIASDTFLHGPINLGEDVGINHHCSLDGGKQGISIGNQTRIASGVKIFAFNHGLAANAPIHEQPVTSSGITIGRDVWIGANTSIRDGVTIGDHAVVGMGSVVCHDVAPYQIVAGNPAKVIGDRRDKPDYHPG